MEYFGLNLLLVLAIIISIVIFLYIINKHIINKRQRSNSIIILDEIKKINEYAAYELNYFENLSNEESKKILHLIPAKRGYSSTVIGKIKIGVNLDNIKITKFNRNINITIPEIKIISHETRISEIGFQTKNPFFQNDVFGPSEKLEEIKILKEENILKNNEIIEQAYCKLKENISSLLLANNKKYTINYKIETPILLIEYDDCKKDNECL